MSLLNAWRKRDSRVVDEKQLVTSSTSALRDVLLTSWPCRLIAVLDEIKLTVLPLSLDNAAELRRFLVLAATSSTLKKMLASDDAILHRIAETVFLESVDRMLMRLLNFFRSDLGHRSVKEVQRKMFVEDASGKYGLMVFLLSLVCGALDPSLKMALQLGESILNALENDSSLFSIVITMRPCSDSAFSSREVDFFSNHTLRTLAGPSALIRGIANAIPLTPAKWETNSGVTRFDNAPLSCVQVFFLGKKASFIFLLILFRLFAFFLSEKRISSSLFHLAACTTFLSLVQCDSAQCALQGEFPPQ